MSNIFLKSDLNGIFNTTDSQTSVVPKWINVIDNAVRTKKTSPVLSETSSAMQNYENISLSNTSIDNSMKGGSIINTFSNTSSNLNNLNQNNVLSNTSSNINIMHGGNTNYVKDMNTDITKLIAMLTSESSSHTNSLTNTNTEHLEAQLRNLLNKNNDTHSKKKQSGGNNVNHEDVKKFFMNLKEQGVSVDVKLNNKNMSDFFNLALNTTTELQNTNSQLDFSATSSNTMFGGGRKKNKEQDGGVTPPGFQAFLDLKKFIAEKLKIPNGAKAGKIAGAVQRDVKAKNVNLTDKLEILEKSKDHFVKNMNNYKELL